MWSSRTGAHRRWSMIPLFGLAIAAIFTLAAACDSEPTAPSAQDARVQILLTDFPLEQIEAAEVWISRIYVVGGGQGQVDLFNAADEEVDPHHFNLLDLQDGVTAMVADATVPAGSYGQLRFVVDSAHVTLEEGSTFADGASDKSLTVPSGFVRVNLENDTEAGDGSLDLEANETTVVVVDFDVAASFVFQGPPTAPHGVILVPVLHQVANDAEPTES